MNISLFASGKDELRFFLTFAPILIGHLVVPTLSYYAGTERDEFLDYIYSIFPQFTRQNVFDMMLSPNQHKFPADYQYLTYLFVHGTYSHMLGNLHTAYICGRPVWHQCGPLAFLFLYFSGGIMSALPSTLSTNNKQHIDKVILEAMELTDSSVVPSFLRGLWNKTVPFLGKRIMHMQMPRYMCGSSGATCTLLGASIVIGVRELYRLLSRSNSSKATTSTRSVLERGEHGVRFAREIYAVVTSVAYLISEYRLMYPSSGSLGSSVHEKLSEILERSKVGHAAHLQGALYGAGLAAIYIVAFPDSISSSLS